jgi:hypothetical protein
MKMDVSASVPGMTGRRWVPVGIKPLARPLQAPEPGFQCDGRKFCKQMTSCDEAYFFLRNCPGNDTDGDGDGVPCEWEVCNRR